MPQGDLDPASSMEDALLADDASTGSTASAASSAASVASPFRDPPPQHVRLRPSKFRHIPATVFVEYPRELGLKRADESVIEPLNARKLWYSSHWERACISNAFRRAGFEKAPSPAKEGWTALWSKHQNDTQMSNLNCLQKVNHFPASWCVGRKDRLARTMQAMQRVHPSHFNFHPENFILPAERDALFRQVAAEQARGKVSSKAASAGGMWIIKPVASSCGKGIRVLTPAQTLALPKAKRALVQRYLHSPYLIDGKKFDLRIYVLVSGVDPLRVYIHSEGLTRISTSDYSLRNLGNRFAHLTNYSINKKAKVFKAAPDTGNGGGGDEGDADTEGFKWSLAAFKKWLSKKESPDVMQATFARIHDLCVKTMIAAESTITPQLHASANYRSNCFELFGCDVILDSSLTPHLLEVNVSPSLVGSSPLDRRIKGTLIADILHIVGLYPHDPRLLKKYGGVGTDAAPSSSSSVAGTGKPGGSNPFAFGSLSKMMAAQDAWRRSPSPLTVDVSALGSTDCAWMLLLTCEDEFDRAASTLFHRVHPTPESAEHYCGLYRNSRFSDHMLGRWVLENGSRGPLHSLIPARYLAPSPSPVSTSAPAPAPPLAPFLSVSPIRALAAAHAYAQAHPPPLSPASPSSEPRVGKPLSLEPQRVDPSVGTAGSQDSERPLVLSSRKPPRAPAPGPGPGPSPTTMVSTQLRSANRAGSRSSSGGSGGSGSSAPPASSSSPSPRTDVSSEPSVDSKRSEPIRGIRGVRQASPIRSVFAAAAAAPRPTSAKAAASKPANPSEDAVRIGIAAVTESLARASVGGASRPASAGPSSGVFQGGRRVERLRQLTPVDLAAAMLQRQLMLREQQWLERLVADSMGASRPSYLNSRGAGLGAGLGASPVQHARKELGGAALRGRSHEVGHPPSVGLLPTAHSTLPTIRSGSGPPAPRKALV